MGKSEQRLRTSGGGVPEDGQLVLGGPEVPRQRDGGLGDADSQLVQPVADPGLGGTDVDRRDDPAGEVEDRGGGGDDPDFKLLSDRA